MNRILRHGALVLLAGLATVAGWRIAHGMLADAALSRGDVQSALRWQPMHPEALLQRAEAQLAAKQPEAAAATARQLLQVEPTDGRGYRVLAQIAAAAHQTERARTLFTIAARRAPRDLPAQAWLAQDALERGKPAEALARIDEVLTLSPGSGVAIYPLMVTLAADPAFAEALADVLRRPPAWRSGMLAALRSAADGQREGAGRVLSALQRNGGFDANETAAWIDSLLREGRWGEAYARWASPIVARGGSLPLLFNGDFAVESTGGGFDWLMPTTPGVILDYEDASGAAHTLHARFLGRRVVGTFLEHRLLLAPGSYQFRVRLRTDALQSENGVNWTLSCEGTQGLLATSDAINGTRGWQMAAVTFTVPAQTCSGQWLRLGNAGVAGTGQLVSGELWFDAAAIIGQPIGHPEPDRVPVAVTH